MSIDRKQIGECIGAKIRMERKNRKLTQMELAEMADTSIQHISLLECGIRLPSVVTLMNLIAILGIDFNETMQEFLPESCTVRNNYKKFCDLGKQLDDDSLIHVNFLLENLNKSNS